MQRTEESGSRDIFVREALSTHDRKTLSELKEYLGSITSTARGRRG
ncbi:MAG: hypothetical protein QXV17_08320 [Candidatus Micrarchaeaceae archaeon]